MLHKNLQVCLFFSINLDDEEDRMGRSKKPIGVKKAKLKRKIDDQTSLVINTLEKKIKNYWRNQRKQAHKGINVWRFKTRIML